MSSASSDAHAPPDSWQRVPTLPFATFESRHAPCALPQQLGALRVEERDDATVSISLHGQTREVPRYWLSRMLFRIALHDYRLGYVETYEGFFYDDTQAPLRFGLRGVGSVEATRAQAAEFVSKLYYAVAPAGYVEDLR